MAAGVPFGSLPYDPNATFPDPDVGDRVNISFDVHATLPQSETASESEAVIQQRVLTSFETHA